MSRRAWAIVGGIVVVVLVAGTITAWKFGLIFTDPTVEDAPEAGLTPDRVTVLTSNLEIPWGTSFLPDGRAVVTERNSKRILTVDSAGSVTEVGRVEAADPGGEGGLLGVAVSPSFAADGLIFVYYTAADDNRIARMKLDGSGAEVIFEGLPKAGNHNGGRLAFGPDGMLYVGTGDAAEPDRAQDPASPAGKILRLTPDGDPAPGNPTPGSPVYSLGHRNPQGLAWDSRGRLFAAEFGQNTYDELNLIEPGANYGWPEVEGVGDDGRYQNPVATWSTGDASPSGIAIVDDKIYMACLRGEKVYRINPDGSGAEIFLTGYGRMRTVTAAPDGTLWASTSNHDGRGSPAEADDRILRIRL